MISPSADEVDQETTLFAWHALSHVHQPKTVRWYVVFAGVATAIVCLLIVLKNFIAAISIGLVSALLYYVVQQRPKTLNYRLRIDGIAVNNVLYPYKELATFNIVYQPGDSKTILVRSKRRFAPMLRLEIGEADPVAIRDVLLEFVPEDQDMEEPFIDIFARRLGF